MAANESALNMAHIAAQAAADKKAENIVVLDVSEQLVITDLFLICSASNDRQVNAIVDAIEEKLGEAGIKPVRREGHRQGGWVLLDYFEMVVHVQQNEQRSLYDLERLWADCPHIPVDVE